MSALRLSSGVIFMSVLFCSCCTDGSEGPFGWCVPDTVAAPNVCSERFGASWHPGGSPSLAANGFLWPHYVADTLQFNVRFLNGDEWQRQQVERYATEWTTASNGKLKIKFLQDEASEFSIIRICFQWDGPSWSFVGSNTDTNNQDSTTMMFGWVDHAHDSLEIRSVILHEFGHAFGFIHEHQQPNANIPWNRDSAITYYMRLNPTWNEDDVEEYVFKRYESTETNSSKYDRWSIMHYSIPQNLTIGDFAIGLRTRLSRTDIGFLRKVYPLEACHNATNCYVNNKGERTSAPLEFAKALESQGGTIVVGLK
jgi:serralysin